MSGLKTYLLSLVALLLILLLGTANAAAKEFNFNVLNKQGEYFAAEYGAYDPAAAKEYCNTFKYMAADAIWPLDLVKPFPSPIPTAADCGDEITSQIAYGCNITKNRLSAILKYAVVKISIPMTGGQIGTCSGTLIGDGRWILTAAHCFTNEDGSFNPILNNHHVLIHGLPDIHEGFVVDAVYIPADFRYYQSHTPIEDRPRQMYQNGDVALLHLKWRLPGYYRPIDLAQLDSDQGLDPVITAGYGRNETNTIDGLLHFRQGYYITNKYDNKWLGGKSGNHGEIYISGSVPEEYKGRMSSWNFLGRGDSGGPILKYDPEKHKFYILAVHSGGLFCNYPGFFARVPYSYFIEISVPYYYHFINSVINGTAAEGSTRCISASGGCFDIMYVLNEPSADITAFNTSKVNGRLHTPPSIVKTGIGPVAMKLHPNRKFVYIVNSKNRSIDVYKINTSNSLEKVAYAYTEAKPMDILFDKNGEYAYVPNELDNSVSIYDVLSEGYLVPKYEVRDKINLNHPISITMHSLKDGTNLLYVLNYPGKDSSENGSISVYKVNPFTQNIVFVENYPTGGGPSQMEEATSGKYLYIVCSKDNTIWVYGTDTEGSHLKFLKTISSTPGVFPYKISFTANGFAYLINQKTQSVGIYHVNKDSGDMEYISSTVTGRNPSAIAVDKYGKNLYVTNAGDNDIWQYKIQSNGRLRFEDSFITDYGPNAILMK